MRAALRAVAPQAAPVTPAHPAWVAAPALVAVPVPVAAPAAGPRPPRARTSTVRPRAIASFKNGRSASWLPAALVRSASIRRSAAEFRASNAQARARALTVLRAIPQHGGADCQGTCSCSAPHAACKPRNASDSSPTVCACVADPKADAVRPPRALRARSTPIVAYSISTATGAIAWRLANRRRTRFARETSSNASNRPVEPNGQRWPASTEHA